MADADAPLGIFDSGFGGLTVARAVIDQLPARVGDLPRRHRASALRAQADRRGPRVRPRVPRPPGRPGRQAARHRLQLRQRRGAARRPRALPGAGRRGDLPRRPVARSRPAAPAGSASSAPAPPRSRWPTTTRSPPPRTSTSRTRACPRFVEFVEAGVTSGPELIGVAHDYLDPLIDEGIDTLILGCTHYPLLTAVISYVMGDAGHAGQQRRGDREGRLPHPGAPGPGARPAPRSAGAPLPHHRRPGGVPADRASLPRARSCSTARQFAWARRTMKLTVIGCSGSYAGPDSSASCYLVEADDPTTPTAPGGSCSTWVPAPWARSSGTPTR